MKKIAIIYKSKYGTTKEYAQMVKEELGSNTTLFSVKEFKKKMFSDYDIIIYGAPIYAGGISGVSFIRNNFKLLSNKKVIIFTVGLSDPKVESVKNKIREQINSTFNASERTNLSFYSFRGGIDYEKLHFFDKLIMKFIYSRLKKADKSSLKEADKAFIDTYGKKISFVDKNYILPLLNDAIRYQTLN